MSLVFLCAVGMLLLLDVGGWLLLCVLYWGVDFGEVFVDGYDVVVV